MTEKEKANELFTKMCASVGSYPNNLIKGIAKKCALVAVDEILNGYRKLLPSSRKYWEGVKKEILKL